ncbi:iron-sulfur cluster assembly accessory protein [Candidatus Woesearchaeota archaeon]|nr:iron-sulfur cluster assembly accessory protein [Candidatus Woesearchaeota archaeon]
MEQETKQLKQVISKDMTIGDVVAKYPSVIEPLQAAGVHCVGCHVSYHETLEQGFKGHGMSDEEVSTTIEKLNKAVEDSKLDEGKEFIVTNKAAEKLKEVLKENNKEGSGLRVEIVPGGCSGFQYGLELDDSTTDLDLVVEEKGVKIIITKENMNFLKGAKLDYVDSLQGGGFKISNPNVNKSGGGCGCGQSFEY